MNPVFRNNLRSLLALFLICNAGVAQAQVFKWIGPDGKVNYGDRPAAPPPATEKKTMLGNVVDSGDLPFELAEARKNVPVVLYTGLKCAACDEGRKLLALRGIPFLEKTVVTNADIASFGGTQVELPQLTVGSARLSGFDPTAWQSRLTAAGYPESNKLPKAYRNPPTVSAGPAVMPKTGSENDNPASDPTTKGTKNAAATRPAPARQTDSTLPGLRF
ncbi:MAG: DUF4124 domain-containing protein [Pseudomonadota bacterium]